MGYNNVPVNGWPQIKDLERLNELAQKIDGLSTLTSSDRDWLDEWESKLPELPEDPATDGVKVLTATTDDGETVKSWEDPASGMTKTTIYYDAGNKLTNGNTHTLENLGLFSDWDIIVFYIRVNTPQDTHIFTIYPNAITDYYAADILSRDSQYNNTYFANVNISNPEENKLAVSMVTSNENWAPGIIGIIGYKF